jgi:hypothetical protein
LQALVSNDCPYAYYINYFTYRFQLALVAASKEIIIAIRILTKLTSIINIVGASCNRNKQLRAAKGGEILIGVFT